MPQKNAKFEQFGMKNANMVTLPNDQHPFATAVKRTTAKFAQTAQNQVANITGRLLCFQTVTIVVDSSYV